MKLSTLAGWAVASALLNLVPCLVTPQGGDTFFHYAMIDCYGSQFWQGDFYPRWCMGDNAGLGSAAPIFYFPLGYYVAALLYPLRHLGLETPQIYIVAIGVANLVTFLTGWRWLADFVSGRRALMGAFLLLWMPYRMEVMVFRNAYAELWVIAFLPLLFMAVRRIITQAKPCWTPLALTTALCMLSHLPVTAIALMGCGIYSLFMARWDNEQPHGKPVAIPSPVGGGSGWGLSCAAAYIEQECPPPNLPPTGGGAVCRKWRIQTCNIKKLGLLAFGVGMGIMATAFYFLPAWYFLDTISPPPPGAPTVWFNGFIKPKYFIQGASILIASAIMTLFCAAWVVKCFRRRREIADMYVRRELYAFGAIAAAGVFFSFEISAPLLNLLPGLSAIMAPWRMRVLVTLATVFFFCVKSQWLTAPRQLRTWKMDYALLAGFFIALGFTVIAGRNDAGGEGGKALQAHIVTTWEEGQMKWVDARHQSAAYIESLFDRKDRLRAEVTKGGGKVEVMRWSWQGITLRTHLIKDGQVRLEQFYFPTWYARLDGRPEAVFPEPGSGLMMLNVPAGEHDVTFYRSMAQTAPAMFFSAITASFAGWVLMALGFLRERRRKAFDIAQTPC